METQGKETNIEKGRAKIKLQLLWIELFDVRCYLMILGPIRYSGSISTMLKLTSVYKSLAKTVSVSTSELDLPGALPIEVKLRCIYLGVLIWIYEKLFNFSEDISCVICL